MQVYDIARERDYMSSMASDDAREILAKLEPSLAGLARGQARLEAANVGIKNTLSEFNETLIRLDERSKHTPTYGVLLGLVLGIAAGLVGVGTLIARFIH